MQPAVTFFIHASRQSGSRIPGLRGRPQNQPGRAAPAAARPRRRAGGRMSDAVAEHRSLRTSSPLTGVRLTGLRASGLPPLALPHPGRRAPNSSGYGGRRGPEVSAGAGRGGRLARSRARPIFLRARPTSCVVIGRQRLRAARARPAGAGPQRGACCDGDLALVRIVRPL